MYFAKLELFLWERFNSNTMKLNRIFAFVSALLLASAVMFAQKAAFNIATYNLRQQNESDARAGNGWDVRVPHVADLIRFHEFDIFGTQEGFKSQLEDLKKRLPGYEYIGVGRDNGADEGEHSAIFYDTSKFDVIDHGDFWLSETPSKPGLGWDAVCVRICTWGHFRHKESGRDFLYFNLHMDHVGKTARVESAKLVKKRLTDLGATLPMFLSGDFNVDQFSPSYATIIEGNLLDDSHDRAKMVYEVTGTYNGYSPSRYTDSRIDHIFVSPNVEVLKYGVLTDTYRTPVEDGEGESHANAPQELKLKKYKARTPSDHFPVLISVVLE